MQVDEADVETLTVNFQNVRRKIESAALAAHRSPEDIALLAVSKGQSANKVLLLHQISGLTDFGENYAQELLQKAGDLSEKAILRWHYIGQLQSNKIGKLVPVVSSIQAVTSEKHAKQIAQHAILAEKVPFPIYLAVNAGSEASKTGLTPAEAIALGAWISREYKNVISLEGIMTIPPASYNDATYETGVPALYQELYHCAKQVGAGKLSLGMSSDLSLAIRAGSSCVRIGTALFGER